MSETAQTVRRSMFLHRAAACRARLFNYPGQPRDDDGKFSETWHGSTEGIKDLVDMVSEIETRGIEPQRLYGGQSAETLMFDLGDGRKIVRKRAPEWGDPDAPKRAADAEQLGSLVANALGARSARVYRADQGTTYIEFVSGAALGGDADSYGGGTSRVHAAIREHGERIGLVDILIGNQDRNLGNMIERDDGSLVGIDTGDSWYAADYNNSEDRQDEEDPDPFLQTARSAMINRVDATYPASHYARESDPERDGYGSDPVILIDNPLTPADVETARARLEALRPEFVRLGRADWLEYSLAALDEIAPHAKGTVSIFND